jgi:hypothetical protein
MPNRRPYLAALAVAASLAAGLSTSSTAAPGWTPGERAAIDWLIDYCRAEPASPLCGRAAITPAPDRAEDERRAAQPRNDPGAISLCPAPHRMTRDGCQ